MNRRKQAMGYLFVILSAVIFSCMPLMVKGIYADGVNSLSVVLLRNLLSAPVTVALARMQKGSLKIPAKALPEIASIGIVGCCLTPLLLFSSYFFMDSGTAMVLHFVYPAAVLVGGVLFYRERVTPGALISIAVCILGISQFYTPGTPLDWRGSALAIISGFGYAAYILMLSHFRFPEVKGFLLNFYIFLINSIVMLFVCIATDMLVFPTTLRGWAFSLLIAVAVNAGAVAMFQRGTQIIGGQRAAILSTMEPITGVFMGILVFREVMTLRTGIGTVLVLFASVLIVLFDRKEAPAA
jgi:drug/metabolite transporter (DMT)-like permease